MAYDRDLAERVRQALPSMHQFTEKKMFGGLSFLLNGNMCCGVAGVDLVVRVGPEGYEEALTRPHTRPMDFTGKPLKGFVYVGPEGYASDDSLHEWIDLALQFAETLPAK